MSSKWKSKDEYENAIKEGEIKGGGPEAWKKVFEKYGYKNPYAKTDENKSVSYIYRMSEKYINEQIEKSPELKKFGGLAPECASGECDLHIKQPENYSFIRERIHYMDTHYIMEIEKRALEGFKFFGEYFTAFWD
jgi:hypothetical protein